LTETALHSYKNVLNLLLALLVVLSSHSDFAGIMSVKDEKGENEDLKALQQKPPVEPVQTTKPSARKAPKPKPKRQHSKSTSKSLCHYMYVSLEEDRSLKRQIGRFISIIGETMGASEVLRVMMFLSLEATDEQIIAAYQKARQGDGKRMN
jgi:hypothetical protein